jgi:uncharacterized protein (TIGR03435 family)
MRAFVVGFSILAAIEVSQGQSTQSSSPSFEVASVKRNHSDAVDVIDVLPSGVFTATNATLRQLVPIAYGIPLWNADVRIVGGPGWMASERFDVLAKGSGPATPQEMILMLRGLLADRFRLQVHNENREVPVYALIMARADGRLGSQLKPSTTDCEALRAQGPLPFQPGQRIPCGARRIPGSLSGGGLTIGALANHLAGFVNRPVLDRTDLKGRFDFDLVWMPDQPARPSDADAAGPRGDPNLPSIYTAVHEQWGLKLDAQRGPVDVLVIDSVERPTED